MLAETVLDLLHLAPEFHALLDGLKKGYREQMIYGLSGSMKSFLAAGLRRETGRPLLIITANIQQAERFREDITTWLPGQDVVLFPPMEYLPFEVVAHSPEVAGARLNVLERLARGDNLIVVAPAAALLRSLVPRGVFSGELVTLEVGSTLDLDQCTRALGRQGYERTDMVEGRGQFARRGDILDVWPISADSPVRIETEWDEIARIRKFDPATQRSVEEAQRISIGPAREFVLPVDQRGGLERIRADLVQAGARLRKRWEKQLKEIEEKSQDIKDEKLRQIFFSPQDQAEKLRERVEGHLSRLEEGITFEGMDQYAPYFYPQGATLLEYFEHPPIVVVDEPARLKEAAAELELQGHERQMHHLENGGLLPGQLALYMSYDLFLGRLKKWFTVYLSLLLRKVQGIDPVEVAAVTAKPMQEFHGQWPLLQEELNRWQTQRYRVLIMAGTQERQQRLRETLRDGDVLASAAIPGMGADGQMALPAPPSAAISVGVGSLEGGFQWPGLRLCVITDGEIYGRSRKRRKIQIASGPARGEGAGARLSTYQDLKVGDYVVHINHGIGKYLGVKSETILGVTRDYIVVQYEGTDRLKLPTEQIDQIQKYVGAEGHEPRLNKLGGAEWSKVKAKVKESIREMAAELLRIQAMRAAMPGYATAPDTPWQREFEDSFPYEETPDQVTAIHEIKRDMEKETPMDRLLLGDVGYGKTEVALRAAFKAAADGKQVAFLVPTTILAQQHFATCKQRFAGFPINMDVLNRFRTSKEAAQILERLARAEVDIIIGTHRLLGDDIRFKDLGLIVVDEEQRFGVQHKEKLKAMRATVDVLTLSATPIPRTLHMAMVGMRDISTISTPPEDRYPVETYVAEYDDELVRDTILRELHRGGQVYFVHNRVQTIDQVASRLQQLAPDARFIVGHGQMKEEKLEQVMLDFMDGEADVLVATTIIESGLDISNVNTIIVDDADHLGLAQLYQLRGRVGRSNRLAYAYFLYKKDKVLTEVAEKRLAAIKDFTELGSGFKIAMRDLEIRGAGNILGPEQHGFIIAVGFDLYTQLLEEAVRELKGEGPPTPEFQASVELNVDAYISDQYIDDPRQKIAAYKRFIVIHSLSDVRDVAEELEDRYGSMPGPVQNLLALSRIKVLAREVGIASIHQTKDRVHVKFLADRRLEAALLQDLNRKYRGRITLTAQRPLALTIRVHDFTPADVLMAMEDILARLQPLAPVGSQA